MTGRVPVVVCVKSGSFFAENPEFMHPDFELRIIRPPKGDRRYKENKVARGSQPTCADCGQPRSTSSVEVCKACWKLRHPPVSAPPAPSNQAPPTYSRLPVVVQQIVGRDRVWCVQCERQVYANEAAACQSRFCKAKVLAA